jgi:Fe(3+) dicitrate transport protein
LLVLALAPFPAAGRQTGPRKALVEGVVTAREDGRALGGVIVEVRELGARTTTDEAGRFRLRGVPAGEWTLRVQLFGRAILERPLRVTGATVRTETLALAAAPVALDPLQVLLDRTRLSEGTSAEAIPGSVHVLGARTVEERPVLYGDVHAYLREVPGVNVQQEDGYGLRPNIGLRGTGVDRSSKITLMEDGVLIAPAPYSAPAAYYFPVAARMEAIEVRKGSSQVRYGPYTIGGALNLVSRPIPADLSLLVDAAGGRDETRRLRVWAGDSGDRFGWLLDTYRAATDGFKRLDGGGSTGFDLQDYVGKLRVSTDLNARIYQELEVKLAYYDQRSDETYLGLTTADFEATPFRRYAGSQEDVMRADHRQVQLRHFVRPSASVDVVTTGYANSFARNWYKLDAVLGRPIAAVLDDPVSEADALAVLRGAESDDDALRVRANNREYDARGIQTAVGLRPGSWGGHEVELGARYHWDREDRFQHDDEYAMRGGRMALTSAGAPGSQTNGVGEAKAFSSYIQGRIELGRLTLSPGVRHEAIEFERRDYAPVDVDRKTPTRTRNNSVSAWIPGLGATYAVRRGFRVFGGVHRGFGPPGPGADTETEAESSVNYELGVRAIGAAASLHLVGFYSDYSNILGAETLASGTQGSGDLFNGGAVAVRGMELQASYDPLAANELGWRLPVRVAYTFTRATFETAFESSYEPWGTVEPGDELPYLAEHQGFGRIEVERGRWSASLSATAGSPMRTVAGQGGIDRATSTDAFVVLDAGTRFALTPGTTLYAGVENLSDATHIVARRPAGARPGLPRAMHLGIRVGRF